MSQYIAINRCPEHKDFWCICIEDEEGSGTRIVGGKCCGRWNLVKRWPLTERTIESILEEMTAAKEGLV